MSLANYPPDHPGHLSFALAVAKGMDVKTKLIEHDHAILVYVNLPGRRRLTLGRIAYIGEWTDEVFAVRNAPGKPGRTFDNYEQAFAWVVNGDVQL